MIGMYVKKLDYDTLKYKVELEEDDESSRAGSMKSLGTAAKEKPKKIAQHNLLLKIKKEIVEREKFVNDFFCS